MGSKPVKRIFSVTTAPARPSRRAVRATSAASLRSVSRSTLLSDTSCSKVVSLEMLLRPRDGATTSEARPRDWL